MCLPIFRSMAVVFMDGVGEAAATTPLEGFFLLLCPCCCDVVSGVMVEQRGFVQEYVQTVVCTVVCTADSWKMVHLVVGSLMEADGVVPYSGVVVWGTGAEVRWRVQCRAAPA